jgi:hypothetical protein
MKNLSTDRAVSDYLELCRARNLAPKTLKAYSWGLEKLRALFPEHVPTTIDGLVTIRRCLEGSNGGPSWRNPYHQPPHVGRGPWPLAHLLRAPCQVRRA